MSSVLFIHFRILFPFLFRALFSITSLHFLSFVFILPPTDVNLSFKFQSDSQCDLILCWMLNIVKLWDSNKRRWQRRHGKFSLNFQFFIAEDITSKFCHLRLWRHLHHFLTNTSQNGYSADFHIKTLIWSNEANQPWHKSNSERKLVHFYIRKRPIWCFCVLKILINFSRLFASLNWRWILESACFDILMRIFLDSIFFF